MVGCGEVRWSGQERVSIARLSPERQEAARISNQRWCNATNGAICLDLHTDPADGFAEIEPSNRENAAYDPARGAIEFGMGAAHNRPYWVPALMHEIGHAIGISGHTDGGLMSAADDRWQRPTSMCIDDHTLAEACEEVGGCPNGTTPDCGEEPTTL